MTYETIEKTKLSYPNLKAKKKDKTFFFCSQDHLPKFNTESKGMTKCIQVGFQHTKKALNRPCIDFCNFELNTTMIDELIRTLSNQNINMFCNFQNKLRVKVLFLSKS